MSAQNPRAAALENANILVGEARSWKHVFALGFGGLIFALVNLADEVKRKVSA